MSRILPAFVLLVGCAATGGHGATPSARPDRPSVSEGEPEIVRTRKPFRIGYREALTRYSRGAPCSESNAPERVIGKPDQRNQTYLARERVITYGFRFPQATLFIRCRGEVVEISRLLR